MYIDDNTNDNFKCNFLVIQFVGFFSPAHEQNRNSNVINVINAYADPEKNSGGWGMGDSDGYLSLPGGHRNLFGNFIM